MGKCFSKKQEYRTADIDIFSNEHENTEKNNETKSKKELWNLDDEYSFDELNAKVFKLEMDCIIDNIRGPVCGRIRSINPTKDSFGNEILNFGLITITSDGSHFFKNEMFSTIQGFKGKKKLSDFQIRPILPNEKDELKERGKMFVKYGLDSHHMSYSEKMLYANGCSSQQFSSKGRVMVDTATFLHFNPNYPYFNDSSDIGGCRYRHQHNSTSMKNKNASKVIPESSLHLCWPTLCGFSFKVKRWGEISVDALREIEFNEDAFSKLVLDDDTKGVVKGLVQNFQKKNNDETFTDIIEGKGGGCVFLLHGPPGTGKTLTAEAVSEVLHRPLYCIDVGELGITPETLEEKLKMVLEVAESWDAVIMIDECDIFLPTRETSDVIRNAMVGIFLRLLEYHSGVMFLTSNRAEDLDAAFQSRISITLRYEALDKQRRREVWLNLLKAALGVEDIDEEKRELFGIEKLVSHELNGRQIKTAIRLALSLSKSPEETLNHAHFVKAISFANFGTMGSVSSLYN